MTVFWLLFGALLGFDAALTYAWLTTRHANRSVVGRVSPYTDPDAIWRAAVLRNLERYEQRRRRAYSIQGPNADLEDTRKPW